MKNSDLLKHRLEKFSITFDNIELIDSINLKNIKYVWGVAPTGPPHIGYLPHIFILKELINIGIKPTIIIADLHTFLSSQEPEEEIQKKSDSYVNCFKSFGLVDGKVDYAFGRNFHLSKEYIKLLFRLSNHAVVDQCDQVSKSYSIPGPPTISTQICTLMQILDNFYFKAHIAQCGDDEAPIFNYGRKLLKGWNYNYAGIYTKIIHDTENNKMGASKPNYQISLLDNYEQISRKIAPISMKNNDMIFDIFELIVFPLETDIKIDSIIISSMSDLISKSNNITYNKKIKEYLVSYLYKLISSSN